MCINRYSQASRYGHIRTILGRKRDLPDINNSADAFKRQQSERQAVNSVIQGTASDLIKAAMLLVEDIISEMRHTTTHSSNISISSAIVDDISPDAPNDEVSAVSLSFVWSSHGLIHVVSRFEESQRLAEMSPTEPPPRLVMQIHDELVYEVPISRRCCSGYSESAFFSTGELLSRQTSSLHSLFAENDALRISSSSIAASSAASGFAIAAAVDMPRRAVDEEDMALCDRPADDSSHMLEAARSFAHLLRISMQERVSQRLQLNVPLVVNISWGPNLGELSPL
jgi:hypothetical protein